MPEYLAPAVYVEEVDTGAKPIEGVSTSTAGLVGVAERGPLNVPMLVTSAGEYRRVFGEGLNRDLYGEHRYLPTAVEGFFTNGGKRVYVTRVLAGDKAEAASAFIFDSSAPAPAASALLRPLTSAAPTAAYLLDVTSMAVTTPRTWLQLGSGGDVEFARLDALPAGENHVVLDRPLALAHGGGAATAVERLGAAFDSVTTLAAAAEAGARTIGVAAVGSIVAGSVIELSTAAPAGAELAVVSTVNGTTLTLNAPLQFSHANAAPVRRVSGAATNATTLENGFDAAAGESVIHLPAAALASYGTADDIVAVGAGASREARRISALARVALSAPLVRDFAQGTPVEAVTETAGAATTLAAESLAGSTALRVNDRSGMAPGAWLRIGIVADAQMEYVQVASVPNPGSAAPDPGLLVLSTPLANDQADGKQATLITAFPRAASGLQGLALPAGRGATALALAGPVAGMAANSLLRLWPRGSSGAVLRITGAATALAPRRVTLAPAAARPHAAGAAVASTVPLFEVRALDAGIWGDRLRVAVREPLRASVASRVRSPAGVGAPDATHIRLESANGVEVGTVLQRWDPATQAYTGNAFKVVGIDRSNGFLLTLDSAVVLSPGHELRSREFDLEVYLLRQPDRANPSRDSAVVASEVFGGLTFDPRHSRYLHQVVGTTWDLHDAAAVADDEGQPLRLSDRRSEGGSEFVRVRDVALDLAPAQRDAARAAARVGPRFDLETLPDGRRRPTRFALRGGDDQLGVLDDDLYIGLDSPDPEMRTGLQALRNLEEISIVAAPGRVSPKMQNALIVHCELMRYRFAVLDGNPPPKDAMADIQAQRQQFDTKYAALYHPWLLIPDPYPAGAGPVPDYPIPPSGHMLGVYARTDIERGVHKAPANEVVRGITGLQRLLNKEQHDILNPYPVNINVIRDFRSNNRGIRVYGGRCITSDSDWKYVNVRRLMIFIEASIDRGLQWVVFEPNAEPLWARVRRSISSFLTLLWRNGALEGTKPEEAYFVKCDRTTMTQTDIDQGRLICLVGVAPVKPAEFVIVRIGLWTAHADE